MNVCILTSSFPSGVDDINAAAGIFVQDFALELSQNGHSVGVLAPAVFGCAGKQSLANISICRFKWFGGKKPLAYLNPRNPLHLARMVSLFINWKKTLFALCRSKHIDHIIAMWAVPSGLPALWAKKKFGIPFTIWALGSDIHVYGRLPLLRNAVAAVLKSADRRFADGITLAREVEQLCGCSCAFVPSSRSSSIRANFSRMGFKGSYCFLFVGRYAPVKGPDVLLEATAICAKEKPGVYLHMFGGGPLEEILKTRAARPDLCAHVTVHPFAPDELLAQYLAGCDCTVIPSRNESIPIALSEAVRLKKPLIVTDVGDMRILVHRFKVGITARPEDPIALAQAMIDMANGKFIPDSKGFELLAGLFDLKAVARDFWNPDLPSRFKLENYHDG
jgi:glycosyltransferase involved in cell wall biosynthesis